MSIELRCYNCDSIDFDTRGQEDSKGNLPLGAALTCKTCRAVTWVSDFNREADKAAEDALAVLRRHQRGKPFG